MDMVVAPWGLQTCVELNILGLLIVVARNTSKRIGSSLELSAEAGARLAIYKNSLKKVSAP
jgi:hypothetical protein